MYKLIYILVLFVSLSTSAATDPTKPFGGVSGAVKNGVKVDTLILDSIIHGEGVHTAIINGKLLKVGDVIGEFTLVAVNNKSVVLRSDNERKKLHIFSELNAK